MKKITLNLLSMLVILTSIGSAFGRWTCCQDMGGSSISCEPFKTEEACKNNCPGGDCEDIKDTDPGETVGGISLSDLDLEGIPLKDVAFPTIADAREAGKSSSNAKEASEASATK